ncbi:MAG: DM13 domain-containing protein, partial [Acidimicrobiia bacterium]
EGNKDFSGDGAHVNLRAMKGNKGNENYDVPASADLSALTSVSLWCDRFNVSFGAAQLNTV